MSMVRESPEALKAFACKRESNGETSSLQYSSAFSDECASLGSGSEPELSTI